MDPTQELVRELFDYAPLIGHLIWRRRRGEGVATKRWNSCHAGRRAGGVDSRGYRKVRVFGRFYWEHRVIYLWMTGAWPAAEVHHRDGDRGNNAWWNIRPATRAENLANRRGWGRSGVRGVQLAGGKYYAVGWRGGRRYYLGKFGAIEDATAAYDRFAREHHGEFYRAPK